MGTEPETGTPTRNDFLGALSRIYWLIRPEDKAVAHDDLLLLERVGKRADELRAQLAAAQAERDKAKRQLVAAQGAAGVSRERDAVREGE